ncbi:MAG: hypothetical protein LUC33_04765 [Prevotellaceae bacterium]|nr:hypothetical protein [Prevotellaceae bacterium]
MPRAVFKKIEVPFKQPDRCADCPFVGLIPEGQRLKNGKETHVCLATFDAMSRRAIYLRKSAKLEDGKTLKRWCDEDWERWREEGYLNITHENLKTYRDPYDRTRQMVIKFHYKGKTPQKPQTGFAGGFFEGFDDDNTEQDSDEQQE